MLLLGIFYYVISLIYTVASKLRSLKDKEYTYDSVGELIVVIGFVIAFCWATIPADCFYFFLREDGKNNIKNLVPPIK